MNINMEIRGFDKLVRKMKVATRASVLIRGITLGAFHLQQWIVRNRLSGPRPRYLGRVTSRLATSISVIKAQQFSNEIIARIGTNVEYARIHEFGGQTGRGGSVTMPARPFMRPAIEDMQNKRFILELLIKHIKRNIEAQA